MRRFSFIIALAILGSWSSAWAQQLSIQYNLAASAYQSGNFDEAEERWIELAGTGDANAQYALGIMHLKKELRHNERNSTYPIFAVHYLHECGFPSGGSGRFLCRWLARLFRW